MNSTITTTAADVEDEMLDSVNGSFGVLIPVIVAPGTTYGEAMATFEDLSTRIAEFVASLKIASSSPEYIAF